MRLLTSALCGGSIQPSTREGTLRLQTAVVRDAQGRPLDGRSLGRPETFRLREVDGARAVEPVQGGARAVLEACRCRALDG